MKNKCVGIFTRFSSVVGKILFLSLLSGLTGSVAIAAAVQECTATGRELGNPQGIVMEFTGDVKATIAKGAACPISKGQTVVNDTVITTGANSSIVLRFLDGMGVSLGENSTFHVQQYLFDEKNSAKNGIVFNLLKGGARFVTGVIGQKNKDAVKISAGSTTIGIRGTAFSLTVLPNGTVFGTVTSGSITVGGTTIGVGGSFTATATVNAAGAVTGTSVTAGVPAGTVVAGGAPVVSASGAIAIPAGSVAAGTAATSVGAAASAAAAGVAGVVTPAAAAAVAAAVVAAAVVIASQQSDDATTTTTTTTNR